MKSLTMILTGLVMVSSTALAQFDRGMDRGGGGYEQEFEEDYDRESDHGYGRRGGGIDRRERRDFDQRERRGYDRRGQDNFGDLRDARDFDRGGGRGGGRFNDNDDFRGPRDRDRGPGPGFPGRGSNQLCQGSINGTWGFKGGRPMGINLAPQGRGQVTVTIMQNNGGETLLGTCHETAGGVNVAFSGGANSGNFIIDHNGVARGVVSGFSFYGTLN